MSQKNILIIVAVIILALVVIKVIGALSRKPVLTEDVMIQELAVQQPEPIEVESMAEFEVVEPSVQAKAPVQVEVAQEALTTTSTPSIRDIQMALKNAGFDPGVVDGKMGKMTQAAIVSFQKANGLVADGKVGSKTWSKLAKYLTTVSTTASQ